jgi:proteasome lid subunit RPN8/RPN11
MTLPFAEIAHQPGVMRYETVNNLSKNVNGSVDRVVGYIHTHPDSIGSFSDGDMSFAYGEMLNVSSPRVEQTAYVSLPDRSLFSFNTSVVGRVRGVVEWDQYLP